MSRPLTAHRYQTAEAKTVLTALCRRHNADHKQFYIEFQPGKPMTTVDEALQTWPPELLACRGWRVGPIRFYGGPPNQGRWYTGSVATMLHDVELYKQALAPATSHLTLPFIESPSPWLIS